MVVPSQCSVAIKDDVVGGISCCVPVAWYCTGYRAVVVVHCDSLAGPRIYGVLVRLLNSSCLVDKTWAPCISSLILTCGLTIMWVAILL